MLEKYQKQVGLILNVLTYIDKEGCFALKGGTAINLFYQNLPRLSVDIDLTYINIDDRPTASANIVNALNRIADNLNKAGFETKLQGDTEKKLICSDNKATIKIEPNFIIRGYVEEPQILPVSQNVEDQFFPVDMKVISKAEVYGGKICAALDRQHPRDLFDIKYLLTQEGEISKNIMQGFVTMLLSGNRPIHEIIAPHIIDNEHILETEFKGMSDIEFTYKQHQQTLRQLVEMVKAELKDSYKTFLLNFVSLHEDLPDYLKRLPAIQWKLRNLNKLKESNTQKFEEQYKKLCECLDG